LTSTGFTFSIFRFSFIPRPTSPYAHLQGDSEGFPPLYIAAKKGFKEIVELLVQNSAKVNKPGSNGATPLHIAAENNHTDIVLFLLDNKADANKVANK